MVKINQPENNKQNESKKPPVAVLASVTLLTITILGLGFRALNMEKPKVAEPKITKSSKPKKETPSSSSTPKTEREKAEVTLQNEARDTKKPFDVETTNVGGGYTFGEVTYFKGDNAREYDEMKMVAPTEKVEESQDEQAITIKAQLTSTLPIISYGNKQTVVKDGSKVSVEVYPNPKTEYKYTAILNYDGNPFGYVNVAEDGTMVARIATYALTEVIDDSIGNDIEGHRGLYQ